MGILNQIRGPEKPKFFDSFGPDSLKVLIRTSNYWASLNENRYPLAMNHALNGFYKFIECPCSENCTCKKLGCEGHWVIDPKISYSKYLNHFLECFVHYKIRENVKNNNIEKGRGKNAVAAINFFKEKWETISLQNSKCLICDDWLSKYWKNELNTLPIKSDHIYHAKWISLLNIDTFIPIDNGSAKLFKRLYPRKKYIECLCRLREDIIDYLERNKMSMPKFRQLDKPGEFFKELDNINSSRPLSRIIDKIFYAP
ncbi:MAG: hypothetical protein GF353_25365 [Candidatus Lokiarchaeota archaeon]|nr:hypothetical protein [Candidatus Lokiarchaeota archaeon]